MFKRQTTGSVVCASCRSLVGVNDDVCYNCGRRNPGLWGFGPMLRAFGNDLGFITLVVYGCSALYVISLAFTVALGGNIMHPFGVPHNPWDETRQPGQSSSGSGIAVAASLCAAALGGDTAGSIRGPAAWCGITGLRPTWGRVSRAHAMPLSYSLDTIGPMTRRVEDNALLMEILAGADPLDPTSSREPVGQYVAAAKSGSGKRARIPSSSTRLS